MISETLCGAASLRYWHLEMHVDGFRFDLASIRGKRSERTTKA